MKEREIIENAIATLKENTGYELEVAKHKVKSGKGFIDAVLQGKSKQERFVVECKAWAAHQNTGAIIQQIISQVEQYKDDNGGLLPMFIADYINPRMGEDFRAAKINYIDLAGNAYIKTSTVHIQIEGKKKQLDNLTKPGRAFTTTGLKTVFALLTNENLLNAPYREIAKQADVALGTIGWVFKDLTDQGFINKQLKTKKRQWLNKQGLITKWVQEFPKLQIKIKLGDFQTFNQHWWQELNESNSIKNGKFGSEYAAAILTKNYKPKDGTLYLQQAQMKEFLQTYRLIKTTQPQNDPMFKVTLYDQFWGDILETHREREHESGRKRENIVEPLLAYAELLATGEPRNREVANEIFEKYLQT